MPYSLCLRAFWSVLGCVGGLARCKGGKAVRSVFFIGIIMDEVRDEALNSAFKALLWEAACFPFFMPESGVRVTVSVTFRVTLLGFAKTKCVD